MNKKVKSGITAVALVLLSIVTCISAVKVYEITFKNLFNTGSVAIRLDQYQVDEHGEKQEATSQAVSPGQQVSYMPAITNQRADAYVRLRLDIHMDQYTSSPVTADNVFAISSGWVQKGNYFYKKEPMKNGETEIPFQGISIPTNWVSNPTQSLPSTDAEAPAQASGFIVTVHADAIQSEHFNPDFDSDTPWGSVVIERSKEEDSNSYSVAKPLVSTNELTFRKSSGLEANTTDLFRNFQKYMAGDTYSDKLSIMNTSDNDITVYFRTRNKSSDLNKKMGLKIRMGDKTLYDGDLFSSRLGGYRKLTKIKPGKKAAFKYTVKLPEDSMNYYSVLKDNVEWQFKVVEDVKDPKTGDNKKFAIWILIFAFSAGAVVYIVTSYESCKKKEKDTAKE